MRLSNEIDQNFVRAAVPDGAAELLSFLPSLGTAETMVFGESVNLPMRVILNTLEEEYRPHSSSAAFTDLWNRAEVTDDFMELVFDRWRARSLLRTTAKEAQAQQAVQISNPAKPPISTIRQNLRRQTPPPARAQPLQSMQATASNAATHMRQRMQTTAANKPQSLSDVKSMLNTAFNRDI